MRSVRLSVLGALAAGLVAAGALAAGAFAAGASTSAAAGCRARQVTVTMTLIKGSFGAGHVSYKLTIKNVSRKPCRLGNRPGIQLHAASGRALPTKVSYSGTKAAVTIAAGRSKSVKLRFSPDIPGPGEPTHGACEPKARSVLVTLTAPGRGQQKGLVKPPTSVCQHGRMQARPLS